MSIASYLMSMATTFFILALVMAGVIKTFQVATDVKEIKEALKDLKRDSQLRQSYADFAAMQPARSPEELVRAVNAESYGDKSPV